MKFLTWATVLRPSTLRNYVRFHNYCCNISIGEWLVVCFLFTRSCHGTQTEKGRNLFWSSNYIQNCINITYTYLHRLLMDLLQLGRIHVNRRRTRWSIQEPEERIELAINRVKFWRNICTKGSVFFFRRTVKRRMMVQEEVEVEKHLCSLVYPENRHMLLDWSKYTFADNSTAVFIRIFEKTWTKHLLAYEHYKTFL